VLFTAQTCGLAVSDSYGASIRAEAPAVGSILDGVQSVLNPGKNAPEMCIFGDDLLSKLIVEALLPMASSGEKEIGVRGVHLNPRGLFLCTFITFVLRILSAFPPA
jgi:hypothetical protein